MFKSKIESAFTTKELFTHKEIFLGIWNESESADGKGEVDRSEFGFDVLGRTSLIIGLIGAWYDIATGEYILGINVLLDSLYHADTLIADYLFHPATSYLAYSVMVRQRATVGDDFITSSRFYLIVDTHWIG